LKIYSEVQMVLFLG